MHSTGDSAKERPMHARYLDCAGMYISRVYAFLTLWVFERLGCLCYRARTSPIALAVALALGVLLVGRLPTAAAQGASEAAPEAEELDYENPEPNGFVYDGNGDGGDGDGGGGDYQEGGRWRDARGGGRGAAESGADWLATWPDSA
ncbi:Protein of unknown function [Gryllus bimaculatus]|nr:Protein of unknown function [Gryllus bimaculatus]